nr:uncharacterized protein LOC116427851 isoform X2 [Nomia melanderi]
MLNCAETASTPPVPPRRKKRKAKYAGAVKTAEDTSPILSKLERKRVAPPPPPPPPRTIRRVKPYVAKYHQEEDSDEEQTSNNQSLENAEETSNKQNSNKTESISLPHQFEDTGLVSTKETNNNANDTNGAENISSSSNDGALPIFETLARKEANKYPPLLFTLHDFQNVMSNTLPIEEETGTESAIQFVSSIHESFHESFQHSLDEEESDMCFRVTTTNLPFGKCLNKWNGTFADHFIEKFDDSNGFVFEDYIDRSSKVNIRRSAGPMCHDNSDEDQPAVPRLTKVRFVIQSPSSSTPDHDLSEDGDSLHNSLRNVSPLSNGEADGFASSVQLTEITDDIEDVTQFADSPQDSRDSDEFGDVPFSTVLKARDANVESLFEYNCTSMDFGDGGSFDEDDIDNSKGSFCSVAAEQLQEQSFGPCQVEKLSMNETDESLMRSEADYGMGRSSAMDGFEEDRRKIEDDNSLLESLIDRVKCNGEFETRKDKIGPMRLDPLVEAYGYVNKDVEVYEQTVSKTVDKNVNVVIEERLEENMENTQFDKEALICDQDFETSEQKLPINAAFDQTLITNDDAKENLLPDNSDINAVEKVSSMEERNNDEFESISFDSTDKSSQQYKRKLFVSESLRNIVIQRDFSSNESEDHNQFSEARENGLEVHDSYINKLDNDYEELNAKGNEGKVVNASFPKDDCKMKEYVQQVDSVSVPVSIRRNSFLENMLCEDETETWTGSTSCEIVAAHPKSSSWMKIKSHIGNKEENKISRRLNESIKMDVEIQKVLQESQENLKKMETPVLKPRSSRIIQPSKKQAGEVKCAVLNELLSNFSNIKLRPVNNERQNDSEGIFQARRTEIKLEISEDKSHQEKNKKNMKSPTISQTQTTQVSPKSPNTFKHFQTSETKETSTKPDKFDFPRTSASEPEFLRANANKEIVKVLVHRSEQDDEEDEARSPRRFHGVRIEPRETRSSKDHVPRKLIKDDIEVESSAVPLQLPSCSEKTDARVSSDEELGDGHTVMDSDPADWAQLDLSRRTGSGARSAIARRIPRPHCNNNDNNRAVTPVAVSDDQSRDTVTITPGRVRSFVKYYEIRREATTDRDSKTNDRDRVDRDKTTGHRSVVSIRRGLEARANEARSYEPKKDNARSTTETGYIESIKTKYKCAAVTSMVRIDEENSEQSSDLRRNDGECLPVKGKEDGKPSGDSSKQPGKVKRKKSVKFQGGHTVIGAKCSRDDGPAGSQDAESPAKGTAPDGLGEVLNGAGDRETADQKETPDADAWSFDKREIAAQIQAAAERGECSGFVFHLTPIRRRRTRENLENPFLTNPGIIENQLKLRIY